MRIRKAFPSKPTIPSSVASTRDAATQQEEMEVSSCPAPAKTTAKEAPEEVETDWESIKARAHKLLGGSSYTCNRPIWPHVLEEHSGTNTVRNGETGIGTLSTNVVEQGGGNAQKQISDLFSNSLMKGNCSDIGVNTKKTTVSSSSDQGDSKGIFLGNCKEEKAETNVRAGDSSQKERADSLKIGSSQCACCATGSCGSNYDDEAEDEEHSSDRSIKRKVKTRKLTSIYADIRSQMPTSSDFKGE